MDHDIPFKRQLMARHCASACVLAVLASTLCVSAPARADDKTAADALFREGAQLLEAGRVAEACPKLAESQKFDPALGTLLYLASCHEKQGLTASAWSEFSSATEWARRTSRNDRLLFAQKHLAGLEGKVSTVRIHAAIASGIEVRVDEGLLTAAALGTPLAIDPGEHQIEASAPGHETWRATLAVPSNPAELTVTVPPLNPTPIAAVADQPEPASEPKQDPLPGPTSLLDSHALAWSALGVAGVSILVGSVFGVLTLSARNDARSECPKNLCSPGGLDDVDRARTNAAVSTVSFGLGLAAALASGYLWIVRGPNANSDPPATGRTAATVVPSISRQQASVSLLVRFE
jgi:hypothetical protein